MMTCDKVLVFTIMCQNLWRWFQFTIPRRTFSPILLLLCYSSYGYIIWVCDWGPFFEFVINILWIFIRSFSDKFNELFVHFLWNFIIIVWLWWKEKYFKIENQFSRRWETDNKSNENMEEVQSMINYERSEYNLQF